MSLSDHGAATRVLVAYAGDALLQVIVLIRLDGRETEQHLVVTGLLLAHGRVVGALGDDSGALRL